MSANAIFCMHTRQATFVPGEGYGNVVTIDRILPCAEPGCKDGMRGMRMIENPYTGLSYERVATPDGWRWVRA